MIQISLPQLKKMLVADGVVSEAKFDEIEKEATRMKQSVVDILISRGHVTDEYYYDLLAKYFGLERVTLSAGNINEATLNLLPENIARERHAIVFGKREDGTLEVAVSDPSDLTAADFLKEKLSSKIKIYLASQTDIEKAFSLYGRQSSVDFKRVIEENIQATVRSKALGKEVKEAATEVPIVAIVDSIVSYAASSQASDIHIEVLEDAILVRYRIDGILYEIVRIPKEVHSAIVARVKLLAGLRLDEHAKPQDGRFRHKLGDSFIDFRVSIIPTFYGEKVEMRLLSSAARPLSLRELGMLDDTAEMLKRNITKSYGLVIVCGPTGSGKTTTLYSVLNMVNRPEVNIVTVEDPIEYNMQYVNQTQVNNAAGITFANGLRSILRQDPNIILVGEIRDEETAEIAVNAALTGHLVFSSLHTNDAPTAVPRLLDMKIPPFLVSAVVNLVLAQRLVRKICLSCIVSYEPKDEVVNEIKTQFKNLNIESKFKAPKTLFKGLGCPVCNHTGYKGRIGIFEALEVTEAIRQLIVDPSFTLNKFSELIREKGMLVMFEDGFRKAKIGMTTIEEVFRVIRE